MTVTKKQSLTLLLIASLTIQFAAQTAGNVMTEVVKYKADGVEMQGYLAYDSSLKGKRPGVIVVHEWTGLNDYARFRAEELARQGYVAFAADMYGGGKVVSFEEARSLSGQVGSDFPLIEKRFNAALKVLQNQPGVDRSQIGAIGYCFGGGIVLNMARMGAELQGIVSFHASINTGLDAGPGDVKTPLLVIQGAGDPAAPVERQEAFKAEMNGAGADYRYIIYPDVDAHNFTNPEGRSYYPEEAEAAWKEMLDFFDKRF